jgi:hypothetical protein
MAFGQRLCLISPWYTHGHIRKYLEDNPDANRLKLVSLNTRTDMDGSQYMIAA